MIVSSTQEKTGNEIWRLNSITSNVRKTIGQSQGYKGLQGELYGG